LRIEKHPILDFGRKKKVSFSYDGNPLEAFEGETIGSALHAAGIKELSHSLRFKRPRGFFCGIGKCSSCAMRVNGVPNVRTCIVNATEGMVVERQDGMGELPDAEFGDARYEILETGIAVVGGGPAGISAAIEAARQGAKVALIDENTMLGGQLIKQTHRFFGSKEHSAGIRGIKIAGEMFGELRAFEAKGLVQILSGATATGYYKDKRRRKEHLLGISKGNDFYELNADRVIIATGANENMLQFPNNDLPGVYGAGGVQTLMNVYGIRPGNRVLMVGAGNVGVIVSYQLLQAGIDVAAVVEAAPRIGAYHVHAAKLRRFGVPILTGHTVKKANGKGHVTGATLVKLDDNWKQVEGTETEVGCDTICLAVGLTPSCELLFQCGAKMKYYSEACGYVPLHDDEMMTTIPGVYVAGDASGIEEASTAIMEGRIAGLAAAKGLAEGRGGAIDNRIASIKEQLAMLREGPFGFHAACGKGKILNDMQSERGCASNDSCDPVPEFTHSRPQTYLFADSTQSKALRTRTAHEQKFAYPADRNTGGRA